MTPTQAAPARTERGPAFHNEMYAEDGRVRPHYEHYSQWLTDKPVEFLLQKQREANALYTRLGITFAVYGDEGGVERAIPFDIVPRIIHADAWKRISGGACQRLRALNAFLKDIYHGQDILRAGVIPPEQVLGNKLYRAEMRGFDVPGDVYVHIAGVDVVRAGEDEFFVLEDNLRTPSGVSYMLENRRMMMRLFPELFSRMSVAPIDHYTNVLLENLRSVAPAGVASPTVVVLTPLGGPADRGPVLAAAAPRGGALALLEILSRRAAEGRAGRPAAPGHDVVPAVSPSLAPAAVPSRAAALTRGLTAFGDVTASVLRDAESEAVLYFFLPAGDDVPAVGAFAQDLYAVMRKAAGSGAVFRTAILRSGDTLLVIQPEEIGHGRSIVIVAGGSVTRPGLAYRQVERAAATLMSA